MVSLPPHTLSSSLSKLFFFQKNSFLSKKKNEQNKIHLILYIWKKKKKLKTTITFEPNITENKKLISWNKRKTTLQTEMENACLYKLQNFLCFSPIYIVSPYNSLFWHSGSYVDYTKHLENILQKCIAIFHLFVLCLFKPLPGSCRHHPGWWVHLVSSIFHIFAFWGWIDVTKKDHFLNLYVPLAIYK